VVDIENQLGYTYVELLRAIPLVPANPVDVATPPVRHHALVSGINRGQLSGSFIIAVHKVDKKKGTREFLGYESVLNRWQTSGCSNCQIHLNVKAHIPLKTLSTNDIDDEDIRVEGSIVGRRTTATDDKVHEILGDKKDGWAITVVDTKQGTVVQKPL
jgi:tyrosinase